MRHAELIAALQWVIAETGIDLKEKGPTEAEPEGFTGRRQTEETSLCNTPIDAPIGTAVKRSEECPPEA